MLKRKLAASLITGIALAGIVGGAFAGINESNDPYFEWRPVPITKRTHNAGDEARKNAAARPSVPNPNPSQDPYFAWRPGPAGVAGPKGAAGIEMQRDLMTGPYHQVEKHNP